MPPSAASTPAAHTAVYVAAVPLRAPRGPAQLLMSAGYALGMWDLQHFMVLLRPDPALAQALVFDFQPRDPEDALAALAVLSRREIPGVVRKRTLRRVPDRRCWLVGHCCCDGDGDGEDAVAAAGRFSERWPTGLVVGEHDCRDYTNGLVEVLTGEKRVLESLRLRGNGTTSSSTSGAAPPWCEVPLSFLLEFLYVIATPRFLRSRGALASVYLNFHRDWRYGFQFFGDVACAQSDDATVF